MPSEETREKYTTVLRKLFTKHSQKPECAYEMIENMFPNVTKIELFSRQERLGWDCWGNEVERIVQQGINETNSCVYA